MSVVPTQPCVAAFGRECFCEPCRVGMAGASQDRVNQAYVQAVSSQLRCEAVLLRREPLSRARRQRHAGSGVVETSTLVFGVPPEKVDQARRLGLQVEAVASLTCHAPIVPAVGPVGLRDNHRPIHGEASRGTGRAQ